MNMTQLRLFDSYDYDDYEQFSSFISRQGAPIPDRSLLPCSTLVAYPSGRPDKQIGFCSLYTDPSVGVGHIDWLCTSPALPFLLATEVVEFLLEGLEDIGKSLYPGSFLLIGCVRSLAMANWAKKAGFTPTGPVEMILKGNYRHDDNLTDC